MTTLFRARRIVTVFFTFLIAQWATAADELLLYVVDGGNGVAGAEVVVDGKSVGTTRPDGSLTTDLQKDKKGRVRTGFNYKDVVLAFPISTSQDAAAA